LASLGDEDWKRLERTINPHAAQSGLYGAKVRRDRHSRSRADRRAAAKSG
jgi:hypothetical protein